MTSCLSGIRGVLRTAGTQTVPAARQVMARWLTAMVLYLVGLLGSMGVAQAETITYYYTNQQGTPLATADAAGNILSTADYRPYGVQALGTPETGPGYTGHVNDPGSGLVYMQARYYDPTVGRFMSADPLSSTDAKPNAFGRYGYASNNPVLNIDPDGRDTCPGFTTLSCIRADTFKPEKSTGKTVQFSSEAGDAAVAEKGQVQTASRPEQGGYLVKDKTTGKISLVKSGTPTRDNTHDRLVLGAKPEGAVGVLHSHVEGADKGLQSDGDSAPLLNGLPNAAEYGGRVGAWEIVDGRLQVRMLDGKMTRSEHDDLQKSLNKQQTQFFEK